MAGNFFFPRSKVEVLYNGKWWPGTIRYSRNADVYDVEVPSMRSPATGIKGVVVVARRDCIRSAGAR